MYDITQPSAGENTGSQVTELEVDDVSLPGLCDTGLLEMCPHIESVKLVFRQKSGTFNVLQHLTLPGLTELCLQGGRKDSFYVQYDSLLGSIMTECFSLLIKFSQIDIDCHLHWNVTVKTILKSIRQHNTLKTIR